jgi:hypothetical protein
MTCPEYHHFNPYYFGEEWEDELRRRDFDFHVFDVKKQEWVAFDVDVDELIDNINNHNNNYDFSNNSKNILNDKTVFAIEGGDALKGLGSIINTDKHVKKYQSQLLQGIIADGSADFSRGKYISVLAKAKITALKTTREHLLGVSDFKDLEQARSLTSKYRGQPKHGRPL